MWGTLLLLAGFYSPNIDYEIRLLWDELVGLLGWWNIPWCIGGNFNIIAFRVRDRVIPNPP